MSNIIEYKGYQAAVEYSAEDHVLFGKILHINSLITFEASESSAIEAAFHDAVNEYLEYCRQAKIEPDKTYSGTLNVRIGPERHRRVAIVASKNGCSVNEVICRSIDSSFEDKRKSTIHNNVYIMTGGQWENLPEDASKWHISSRLFEGSNHEQHH